MGPALSGSDVPSAKVFVYRSGHGTSGMARHACRATRPTAAVTLRFIGVPLTPPITPAWER